MGNVTPLMLAFQSDNDRRLKVCHLVEKGADYLAKDLMSASDVDQEP